MPGRSRAVASVLVSTIVLAGCSGPGSERAPSPDPSGAGTGAESPVLPGTPSPADLETVQRQVPLTGSERSPLTWRLPPTVPPPDRGALSTVRYNVALETAAREASDPRAVAGWWSAIATGGELDAQYRYAADATPDPEVGPRRAWLAEPERTGPRTWTVEVCLDVSSVRIGVGAAAATPPPEQRVRWLRYTVETLEGESVPKVSRVAGVPVAPPFGDDEADRAACDAWATGGDASG